MTDKFEPDEEDLEEVFEEDRAFWERPIMQEARAVSTRVHELLGGVDQQLEGNVESERVRLDLPKAFVYLAAYLGVRDAEKSSEPSNLWQSFERGQAPEKVAHLRDWYIEGLLRLELHRELHDLATGAHHLLHAEEQETDLPPKEGRETAWQRQKAAKLLRLALLRMTDDADPPDVNEIASRSTTSDVHALMVAAYEMAGKALAKAVDLREGRSRGDPAFDDDIPC